MVTRRPVILISGQKSEVHPGDYVLGAPAGNLIAGSGLDGGGDLLSATVTNVSLAPNPSGLILVDNKYLATDGVAQRTAETALASGNYGLSAASTALASGVAGSSLAATASASGNAALSDISAIQTSVIRDFVAASDVKAGYAVGVDVGGKVESIRYQGNDELALFFGSETNFGPTQVTYTSAAYDSTNNRVVVAYSDLSNSYYATAIVGTVSDTSISFGTPVVFRSTGSTYTSCVYHSANSKVVISVTSTSGYSYVGTVSGTSISFGSAATFESGNAVFTDSTYDVTNDRVVIVYVDQTNSNYGTAVVGTVSGTTISFGTPVVFSSFNTTSVTCTYDSTNNRVVVALSPISSNYGIAIVGTVSGTTISFGTGTNFHSSIILGCSSAYDSTNNRVVITYVSTGTYVVIGTVSGTSISVGSPILVHSSSSSDTDTVYDSSNNRVAILTAYNTDAFTYGLVGRVSGTSITISNQYTVSSAQRGQTITSVVYDSVDDRIVFVYSSYVASTPKAYARVAKTGLFLRPSLTGRLNNFIGIAQSTVASGAPVSVRLPGSYDQNNTGLTTGALYYVDPTTSGFTTAGGVPAAWSGSVNWAPVGRAVNSTTLMLTDMI